MENKVSGIVKREIFNLIYDKLMDNSDPLDISKIKNQSINLTSGVLSFSYGKRIEVEMFINVRINGGLMPTRKIE